MAFWVILFLIPSAILVDGLHRRGNSNAPKENEVQEW